MMKNICNQRYSKVNTKYNNSTVMALWTAVSATGL